ncbi:MAG TPA: LysR substrate-binding domain-containing protein [Candidatus Polarisedimenticolia bacterium]
MDIEVRHLRLVAAIAEEGSVTRAGARLNLTQSALSHQLRDIETRLGAPLFLRLSKKMILTQSGETLLATAREILDRLQQTEQQIRRLGSDSEGILRITIECYTCYHWLPSLLGGFRKDYPRVEVRIQADQTKRPIEALLEGSLDLAIVSDPVDDRRIRTTPLFEDELVVVMPPDHPLASRPFIRPRDFAGEHLFIYPRPEESTVIQRVLKPAGAMPARITQAQLTEAIFELVKAGLGICVMATWAITPWMREGTLVTRPLTRKGFRRHWTSARLRAQTPPAYLLAFERLLASDPLALRRVDSASRAIEAPSSRG